MIQAWLIFTSSLPASVVDGHVCDALRFVKAHRHSGENHNYWCGLSDALEINVNLSATV